MEITLRRHFAVDQATIGTMTIGDFTCFTLEDVIRTEKIKSKTAIFAGTYPVILCESPRFSDSYEAKGLGRIVPLVDKVPQFSGIRIHVGNKAEHTDGCILVGDTWDQKSAFIGGSTSAFKRLMKVLGTAKGNIRILISNDVGGAKDKISHPPLPLYYMFRPGQVCIPA
ncbi:MAG TPA: DUF5675 family protein [Falsiroseomonas sp.]|jgi:hypothetical protein|nr:DUF5675 family protein [Falsiroseomonas sp.]